MTLDLSHEYKLSKIYYFLCKFHVVYCEIILFGGFFRISSRGITVIRLTGHDNILTHREINCFWSNQIYVR